MSILSSAQPRPRDAAIISLVGVAHGSSHVMQLALPPLFPILYGAFGVSNTELGLIFTLFYGASGLGQTAAGVLVDRYGAHRLLIGGLALLSGAIALAGLVSAYWMLLPLAVIAGLGNSVFHPADLSILSHRVSETRLGRAYAVHGITGYVGYAAAPALVTFIATVANWRVALLTIGIAGLAVAATLYVNRGLLAYHHAQKATVQTAQRRSGYLSVIGAPVVLMAFGYFALTAFAGSGLQTFSTKTLTAGYGLTLQTAAFSLTLYLFSAACGMVLGGFLAERTQQHHRVAMTGIAAASLLMLAIAAIGGVGLAVVPLMALAGAANGVTGPSRDVLVRRAAGGAGTGSVFGFVYSGFDLGSSTAPLLFGALLDYGEPRLVFLGIAIAFALAVPTVMQVRNRARGPAPLPAEAD
jgi:FSR family fosmidomycin resistance protein-like MFS transporter